MRLHRVLADTQPISHLLRAQPLRNQLQHFQFPRGDAQFVNFGDIDDKETAGGHRHAHFHGHFFQDDLLPIESQTEPNADSRKSRSNDRAVDLERMLEDKKAVFDELHAGDQQARANTECQDALQLVNSLIR